MHSHIHTPRHTQCEPKHQTHINADTVLVACTSTASIHTHTYTQTQSGPKHTKYLFTLTLLCTLLYSQHVCMHSHAHISTLSLSLTHPHPYPHCVTHTHTELTDTHAHTHKHTWVIVKTGHLFIVAVQTCYILCIDVFLQGSATKPTHTYHTHYTHTLHILFTHKHIFPIQIYAAQLQNVFLSVLLMCTETSDKNPNNNSNIL